MIRKIRDLRSRWQSEEKRQVVSNFFYLSLLQAANYILPFLTLPYLTRVLGVENFGFLSFVTATTSYLSIITDFGFNLSATKDIALNIGNRSKINEIVSSVIILKSLIMSGCFILLCLLVLFTEKFNKNGFIYFIAFGSVFGQVFFPMWFFQGVQKMKYITCINLFSRLSFTILVFVFIKDQSDMYLVPLFNSMGTVSTGIIGMVLVHKHFGVRFHLQTFETLVNHLREASTIFVSGIASIFREGSATFILGMFCSNTAVGCYSVAEKIVLAINNINVVFSTAIYPYVCNRFSRSKIEGIAVVKKIGRYLPLITLTFSLLLFFFAKNVVNILSGNKYHDAIVLVRIMAFYPFIVTFSCLLGTQTMLPLGMSRPYTKILLIGGILNLFISLAAVTPFQGVGVSLSKMLTELFTVVAMYKVIEG